MKLFLGGFEILLQRGQTLWVHCSYKFKIAHTDILTAQIYATDKNDRGLSISILQLPKDAPAINEPNHLESLPHIDPDPMIALLLLGNLW